MESNELGACEGADDVTLRMKYATAHLKMSDGCCGCRRQSSRPHRGRWLLKIISFYKTRSKILWRINGLDIFLSNEFYRRWLFFWGIKRMSLVDTCSARRYERLLIIHFHHANIQSSCLLPVDGTMCWWWWDEKNSGRAAVEKKKTKTPAFCNVCVCGQQHENICADASHEETAQQLTQQHLWSF